LAGYFNLTAYYGFAARVYEPRSDEAQRTLRYVLSYGSRLLGLLRARDSADNTVYEVEQLKFLADNDEADQIVLTFYGKLAHGMTRGTFVAGESHNIGPMLTKWPSCREQAGCVPPSVADGWTPDEYYRAMYLPPNTANNTTFLQALRLMLVCTVTDGGDLPRGLGLAYATPRAGSRRGGRSGSPTSRPSSACSATRSPRTSITTTCTRRSTCPIGIRCGACRFGCGYRRGTGW
jgi:hypothetical protein